jgi:hypothetical protein
MMRQNFSQVGSVVRRPTSRIYGNVADRTKQQVQRVGLLF